MIILKSFNGSVLQVALNLIFIISFVTLFNLALIELFVNIFSLFHNVWLVCYYWLEVVAMIQYSFMIIIWIICRIMVYHLERKLWHLYIISEYWFIIKLLNFFNFWTIAFRYLSSMAYLIYCYLFFMFTVIILI